MAGVESDEGRTVGGRNGFELVSSSKGQVGFPGKHIFQIIYLGRFFCKIVLNYHKLIISDVRR